jgi:hypothetical protein
MRRRSDVPNRLTASLNYLVGKLLELRWDIKAECCGSLEVDYKIELLRPLDRQVTGFGSMQDLPDVFSGPSEHFSYVRPIGYEAAGFWKFAEQGNEGEPFGYRKLADLL